MPGRRGARAGRRMPRAWTALCLLALLPSGMGSMEAPAPTTSQPTASQPTASQSTASPPTGGMSTAPTSTTHPDSPASSAPGNTSAPPVPPGSSGTAAAGPGPTVRVTAPTLAASAAPTPAAPAAQAQTSAAGPTPGAPPSTSVSDAGPKETPPPSTSAGRTSEPPRNNTGATTAPAGPLTSRPPTPGAREGKIVCSQVKEVRLASGICLELNETSSCEDFRKRSGEELAQVLCQAEPAGAGPCSWLLAQSEVRPHCLLLVVANGTELSSKLQFLREHQSDLTKLGIHNLSEEAVSQHQSYSRKTLIALVTSGVLLAILGVTGYFLMNRRSWSPSGERLDEDPYYTEHGAGLGRGTGPETSPGAQGKARAPRGAQENGTGQATSRNGHSPRQHVVADTEL